MTPLMDGRKVVRARVAMGAPILEPEKVPVSLPASAEEKVGEAVVNYPIEIGSTDLKLSFASMGNPHAVAFIEEPLDDFRLHTIGPTNRAPLFVSQPDQLRGGQRKRPGTSGGEGVGAWVGGDYGLRHWGLRHRGSLATTGSHGGRR